MAGIGIAAKRGQNIARAGFRLGAQQAGKNSHIRSVPYPGGAEGAEQLHSQGLRPRQSIRRQGAAEIKKITGRFHGADGVGAGRTGPYLEEVEERGSDGGAGSRDRA